MIRALLALTCAMHCAATTCYADMRQVSSIEQVAIKTMPSQLISSSCPVFEATFDSMEVAYRGIGSVDKMGAWSGRSMPSSFWKLTSLLDLLEIDRQKTEPEKVPIDGTKVILSITRKGEATKNFEYSPGTENERLWAAGSLIQTYLEQCVVWNWDNQSVERRPEAGQR